MRLPDKSLINRFLWPVKILVTGGLLFWLITSFPMGEVFARIRGMNWWWFLLTTSLGQVVWYLQAWRWRQTTHTGEDGVPPMREFLYHTSVGYFFNILLPSGLGGDAVKSVAMGRSMKDVSGSVASVFMSRVMGITTMLLMYWLVLLLWPNPLPHPLHVGMGALTIATVVGWVIFLGPWQFHWIENARFRRLMEFRAFMKVGGKGWGATLGIQVLTLCQQWIFFQCVGVPMPWIPVVHHIAHHVTCFAFWYRCA